MCAVVVVLDTCLVGLSSHSNQTPAVYYTVDGLAPDKWASAWLLSQRVESGGVIEVRPRWALCGNGIPFDVPGEPLRRKDGLTTFEIIAGTGFEAPPHVTQLGSVLSDLELNAWTKNGFPETTTVKHYYRALQQKFDRNNVPLECYLGFFASVAEWLKADSDSVDKLAEELESFVTVCSCDQTIRKCSNGNSPKTKSREVPVL